MLYKKGDTLQIKQGSCIVLETSINANVFFEEMHDTRYGWKHPIYRISADVDAFLGSRSEIIFAKLKLYIFHRILYGDTKVAILDSEVYGKIACSVATEIIGIDNV